MPFAVIMLLHRTHRIVHKGRKTQFHTVYDMRGIQKKAFADVPIRDRPSANAFVHHQD